MTPYTLYTMDNCTFCTTAKKLLNKAGIPFVENKDLSVIEELKLKTVPQLQVDENHFYDFEQIVHFARNWKGEET